MKYALEQHKALAQPFLGADAQSQAPLGDFKNLSLASSSSPSPSAYNTSAAPAYSTANSAASPPAHAPAQAHAKVLWAHAPGAGDADELPLRAGEVVTIVERTSAEWWKGYVAARGESAADARLFPANYVEEIKAPPASAPAPATASASGARSPAIPPIPGGTRARFTTGAAGTAPTAVQRVGSEGLATESEEERKARRAKLTKIGNSNAGSAAAGGFAAGAASSIVRRIF